MMSKRGFIKNVLVSVVPASIGGRLLALGAIGTATMAKALTPDDETQNKIIAILQSEIQFLRKFRPGLTSCEPFPKEIVGEILSFSVDGIGAHNTGTQIGTIKLPAGVWQLSAAMSVGPVAQTSGPGTVWVHFSGAGVTRLNTSFSSIPSGAPVGFSAPIGSSAFAKVCAKENPVVLEAGCYGAGVGLGIAGAIHAIRIA